MWIFSKWRILIVSVEHKDILKDFLAEILWGSLAGELSPSVLIQKARVHAWWDVDSWRILMMSSGIRHSSGELYI